MVFSQAGWIFRKLKKSVKNWRPSVPQGRPF